MKKLIIIMLLVLVGYPASLEAQYKSKIQIDTVLITPAYNGYDYAVIIEEQLRFYSFSDSTASIVIEGYMSTRLRLDYIDEFNAFVYKPLNRTYVFLSDMYARGELEYIMMYDRPRSFYIHLKDTDKSFFIHKKRPQDGDGLPHIV